MFHLGERIIVVRAGDSNTGRTGKVRSSRLSLVPSPRWEVILDPLPGNPFTSAWYDNADLQKVP